VLFESFSPNKSAIPEIDMSIPIHAVQHIRRMRSGAQAHLLRASDNAYYVTKFKSCPQGIKILANEMFATRLGIWLGLPMPRVAVIEVSDWLITHTGELRVDIGGTATRCSSGLDQASAVAMLYPYWHQRPFKERNPFQRGSEIGNLGLPLQFLRGIKEMTASFIAGSY
jgi:hypothetical protein